MNPIQIVFLFDLNAYSDLRPRSGPILYQKLQCLRLSCLRILTHYSTTVPNLKWGFKFFDSCGKITQTMSKFFFSTVSLESYETLENEISLQYQRHASYLEALAVPSEQSATPSNNENVTHNQDQTLTTPLQLLQLALNEILCEFQWESSIDAFSPCVTSRNHQNKEKRNLLFSITRCAQRDCEFQEFFGVDYASVNSLKLSKLLLSQSLQEKLFGKASILWIWLNTSESQQHFEQNKPEILKLLSDTLKSLQCALMPLSVLSQPTQILRFEKQMEGCKSTMCKLGKIYSSIVPFSTVFLQSISYPFYKHDSDESAFESTLCFLQNDITISVIINRMFLPWNKKENNLSLGTAEKAGSDAVLKKLWTKFTVHFSVPMNARVKACEVFFCLPSACKDASSSKKMQDLNKYLISNNINLFLSCKSVCGTVSPGLFSPLSDTTAVISIPDRKSYFFLSETHYSTETFGQFKVMSSLEIQKKIEEHIQHLTIDMINTIGSLNDMKKIYNPILKPFQMECLENWFEPASSTFSILSKTQEEQHSCSSVVDTFHSKLFESWKKKDLEENPAKISETTESVKEEIPDEICKDISYDQLIAMLAGFYDAAVNSMGNVMHTAKKIIKLASSFFLQKSIISYEETMKNFMAEFFCTTSRKLSEKYNTSEDAIDTTKLINECQMQTFLALEMELLFPSVDGSSCVNMVTSFLRTMSFFSGATELNKFLFEVLKENYSHNLLSTLVEIGDELDIPLNSEDDSLDDSFEPPSFTSVTDLFDSAFSSTLSVKSSSSTISNKSDNKLSDNRRLQRKRSDISDSHTSRQVLLPAKSPRRKKNKTLSHLSDGIPTRYSPRLASKKKKEKFKNMDNKSETVRRNLFPRDKKPQTPRTSKSSASPFKKNKAKTPKGHHVLKTNFVAETPAHKQKHSALQRRKSQVEISPSRETVKEIAESPSITQKARDATNLKLLQKLKERHSQSAATLPLTVAAKSLPSTSYSHHHTPESKRRLSLKLFSKLMTSPTARLGLKKCSKRLFDQVSPQVNTVSKKLKLSQEVQDSPVEMEL